MISEGSSGVGDWPSVLGIIFKKLWNADPRHSMSCILIPLYAGTGKAYADFGVGITGPSTGTTINKCNALQAYSRNAGDKCLGREKAISPEINRY